jgi:hypothetical protein
LLLPLLLLGHLSGWMPEGLQVRALGGRAAPQLLPLPASGSALASLSAPPQAPHCPAPLAAQDGLLLLACATLAVFAGRKYTQPIKDDIGDKSVFEFYKLSPAEQAQLVARRGGSGGGGGGGPRREEGASEGGAGEQGQGRP